MSHLFQDIKGVKVIVDDLAVWEEDVEHHYVRLKHVLDRYAHSSTGSSLWATC